MKTRGTMKTTAVKGRQAAVSKESADNSKALPKKVLLSVLLGIEMDYWQEGAGDFEDNTVDFTEMSNSSIKKVVSRLKTYMLKDSEYPIFALKVAKRFTLLNLSNTRTVNGVKSDPSPEHIAELMFWDTKTLRTALEVIHADLSSTSGRKGGKRGASGASVDSALSFTMDAFTKAAAVTREEITSNKAQGALMAETRKANALKAAKKANKAVVIEEEDEEEEVIAPPTPKRGQGVKARPAKIEEVPEEVEDEDFLDVDAPDEEEIEEVKPVRRAGGKKPRL